MHELTIRSGVQNLRKHGYTFREIQKEFPFVSKSTISGWVRGIELSPGQKRRILEKELKGRIKLMSYNEQKHQNALRAAKHAIREAKASVGYMTKRDLLIAGSALYWAEGYTKSRNVIEMANSSPKIVAVMVQFLRKILKIPSGKFRCGLILHPNLNEASAKKFWASLTRIPLSQFNKTYTKPPKSSTGKMHNILYLGTVKIRVSDTKKLHELKGYLEALATMG